jgi:hypothetical protein
MMTHRKAYRQLYEYLREELSDQDRKAVEAHLTSCRECTAELKALRDTSELLDVNVSRASKQRTELYWQHFPAKVERRIESDGRVESSSSFVQRFLEAFVEHRKPFGMGFASALTLMMIAFGIWSIWFKGSVSDRLIPESSSNQAAEGLVNGVQNASLESEAADYLDQSKVLLIGLLNMDTKSLNQSGPMLQREQEISRKLVRQSQNLTVRLNDPSQRRLKELISDLQVILVQIANLGAGRDLPGVEIVRNGIQHNGILFKLNLEEIRRATPSPKDKESKIPVKSTM